MEEHCAELNKLLFEAAGKNLPKEKVALLFSGGVDSSLLALLLKRAGAKFTCYTAAVEEMPQAQDLQAAEKAAAEIGAELRVVKISLADAENLLPKIARIVGHGSVVHIGVALALYCALRKAADDGINVAYTGAGADELFGGYVEFRKQGAERGVCERYLARLKANDLPRDTALGRQFGIEMRTPYLDENVVDFALALPEKFKLDTANGANKAVLRELALKLGLSCDVAGRAKKAAQYGSGMDKAIEKIARKHCFKSKGEFIKSFFPVHEK